MLAELAWSYIPLHPPLATESSMPHNSIYENTGMQAFQVNLTIELGGKIRGWQNAIQYRFVVLREVKIKSER